MYISESDWQRLEAAVRRQAAELRTIRAAVARLPLASRRIVAEELARLAGPDGAAVTGDGSNTNEREG